VRRNAAQFCCARQRSSMITRRMHCHAALGGCVIEAKNRIRRIGRFERADLLKIFALKK
jgi:hypothetical protein